MLLDTSLHRRGFLAAMSASTAALLSGCQQAAESPKALSDVVLSVWHSRATAANFMPAAGLAPPVYQVRPADLPGGAMLLNGYAADALDYAYMSQIVAVFGMQSGVPLKIIATFTGDVNNAGILVQKASSAKTVGDLRGRTVAYTPSTNEHYYLLKFLEGQGMTMSDIQPVALATADINGAFTRGHVEARATVGGIVGLLAETQLGARWLVRSIKSFNSGDYQLTPNLNIAAGANNLFNTYPDRNWFPTADGGSPYTAQSPFGTYGGYYYGRVTLTF
ncbi:MAG: ABC transporter substrate-binding protein [Sphingobium sp.]